MTESNVMDCDTEEVRLSDLMGAFGLNIYESMSLPKENNSSSRGYTIIEH